MQRVTVLLCAAVITTTACGGRGLFRQYEYEEEIYLSLDGTAIVYVNSSVAALNALRGLSLDISPGARLDRARVREYYATPFTRVTSVTPSRRNRRPFVHVRIEVDDVGRLNRAAPFAWSAYQFKRDGNLFVFRQTVGRSAGREVGQVGWRGGESVAFRLHLPSKIVYHNAPPDNLRRGNILVWEQSLRDRLSGQPLVMDARMETQSILYRTLWLFATTFAVVAVMFAGLIWWILRGGARSQGATNGVQRPDPTVAENDVRSVRL